VTSCLPATNASISITQPSRASVPSLQHDYLLRSPKPKNARQFGNTDPFRPWVSCHCICPTDRAARIAVATNEHGWISKATLHETTWSIRRRNIAALSNHDSSLPPPKHWSGSLLFCWVGLLNSVSLYRWSLRNRRSFYWFSCTAKFGLRRLQPLAHHQIGSVDFSISI